jgi:hypothetical protein
MARLHLRRGEVLEAGKCARTALVQLSPQVAGRHPALAEARSIALGSAAADPSEQAG